MWWWKKRNAKSSSVSERIPLLNSALETGMCDDAIVDQLFSELDSTPESLLPAAMPKLTHTAFLLWKSGRGASAKRLLFTCLAWYLRGSNDKEEIASLTENLKYIFDKEGRSVSDKDIHAMSKDGRFDPTPRADHSAEGTDQQKPDGVEREKYKTLIDGLVGGDEQARRKNRQALVPVLAMALASASDLDALKADFLAFRNAGWALIGEAEYGEGEYTLAAAIETLIAAIRQRPEVQSWVPLVVDERLERFMQAPVAELSPGAWSALDKAINDVRRPPQEAQRLATDDGRTHSAASGRADSSARSDGRQVLEIADGKVTVQRTRFEEGLAPAIFVESPPLTTFNGWLKRLDPGMLNAIGKLAIASIFPMFGESTPERYLARSDRLSALGIKISAEELTDISTLRKLLNDGVPVKLRRHRRYAGGDGLLPRNCYASISKDDMGDDAGTLSRECMAYADTRVPGLVHVSDSTSAKLNSIISEPLQFRPGFCGTYVLLFPPQGADERKIFSTIYGDLLGGTDQGVNLYVLETRVEKCTIEDVVDLRLPDTQKWFFDKFKNGDGDFLIKEAGTVREFYDLIPTLMHPSLGGSDVTHAIGSWMRSSGVNGLIFPSARSNASATIRNGALVDWHGWNLVDYRTARHLPATEKTNSVGGWLDFLQPGVKLEVSADGEFAGSWRVTGLQARYERLQDQIENAGMTQRGPVESSPSRGTGADSPTTPDIGPSS
jgi:hypothetical protein